MMQSADERWPSAPREKAAVTDPLDQRFERIFEGNSANKPERQSEKGGSLRSQAAITLALSWYRTSHSSLGAFHPEGSYHCRDFAAADQLSGRQLDALIADPAEAAALQKEWQSQAPTLIAKHGTEFDVRQFPERWHYHEKCSGCYGNASVLCTACYSGKTSCSFCGGRRGEYGSMNGLNHQVWIACSCCNGGGTTTCSRCRGSCRVSCMGCAGNGYFTITFEAKITAKIDVAHAFVGEDIDGAAAYMAKLPLDALLKQSALFPIQAEQLRGGVRLRILAETSYSYRTYGIDRWTFDVCAVGHDNLIPDMPPIMDHVLGDLTANILSETNPTRIHTLTSESAFTRDLLRAIGGLEGYNLDLVRRRYENSMSPPLFDKLGAAVKGAYDGVAGASGRKIWFRNALAINIGLFLLIETGALAGFINLTGQRPTDAAKMGTLVLLALALIAITWASARSSAFREAKRLLSSDVRNCPGMGWTPGGAVLATCATVAYLVSAMQAPSTASRASTPIATMQNAGANTPATAVVPPRL